MTLDIITPLAAGLLILGVARVTWDIGWLLVDVASGRSGRMRG